MNKDKNSILETIEYVSEKYDIVVLEEIGNPTDIIYMAISKILGVSVFDLKLNKNSIFLDIGQLSKLEEDVMQMINESVPIQYITGRVNIYNEEYIVNSSVLIPRSDTEILIETAINYIEKYSLKNMLDICTGSGAVGISISKNSTIEKADLSDISKEAIEVAEKNIKLNEASNKCKVYLSDLFNNIPFLNLNKYDIIVGNPPYIESEVVDGLSSYVKNEPRLALDGGITGLDIYIRIFNEAQEFLKDKAFVLLEIGYNQADSIKKILTSNPKYELLEVVKDINSKDRVIVCRFHQR